MISIDEKQLDKKLETVQYLSAFADFIRNPGKFSELLTELTTLKKEALDSLEAYRQYKNVAEFSSIEKGFIAEEDVRLDKKEKELLIKESDIASKQVESLALIQHKEQDIQIKKQELDFLQKSLEAEKNRLASMAKDIEQKQRSLSELNTTLNGRENVLNQKAVALKSLLG